MPVTRPLVSCSKQVGYGWSGLSETSIVYARRSMHYHLFMVMMRAFLKKVVSLDGNNEDLLRTKISLFLRDRRVDVSNFFLYEFRNVSGFLITGKNSGTHWLKYMLSCAIADEWAVSPPAFSSGEMAHDIIGNPRTTRPPPGVPRIASSHTIPSIAFTWPWLNRLLKHPPVVVLVRDIEEALISHYVKWQHDYGVSFDDYLRGDPTARRFKADIWWYIRFFNRWGAIAESRPDNVLVLRYEELQHDPKAALVATATQWNIRLTDNSIKSALRYASLDAMKATLDPAFSETVIPTPQAKKDLAVTSGHRAYIRRTLARHLRHNLGYPLKPS